MKRLISALLALLICSTLAYSDLLDGPPPPAQSRAAAALAAQGAGRVSNLTAANDVTFPAVEMRLAADYAVFYNPQTGQSAIQRGAAGNQLVSNLACAINGAGPAPGFRDQSGAFVSGNTVHWYLIAGPVGVSCETSLTAPTALNSGGTTGPVLPPGYTSYAYGFPIVMAGAATLTPTIPIGGGTTQYTVRGNTVNYTSLPFICPATTGFPTATCSVALWLPAIAQNYWLYIDIEAGVASGTLLGGALVLNGPSVSSFNGRYLNSLYVSTANIPAVNNTILGPWPYPVGGDVTIIFCSSSGPLGACASGTITEQVSTIIAVSGYTFPQ